MLELRVGESERDRATRLMKCVITSGAVTYAALNDLYVELKIGGGFFRGRKMAPEIDQVTRYELVAYITALAAVLTQDLARKTPEVGTTVAALEELVFAPEWDAARPAYQRYVARFRDISPGDLALMPRQKMIMIQFRQTLIDIWRMSPELLLEDGLVQRYCEALSAVHEAVEGNILKELYRGGTPS